MARQPLLPRYKNRGGRIGPKSIEERPEFVNAIGRCVLMWPFVEHQLGVLLGIFLRADNEATIAVFTAIRRGSIQKDALNVAAEKALDPKALSVFNAILAAYETVEKERADLAHGQWGSSATDANIAIWVEAKNMTPHNALVNNAHDKGQGVSKSFEDYIYIWSLKDITDIYDRMHELFTILHDFTCFARGLKNNYGHWGKTGPELLDRLAQVPQIREALQRHAGK
jgi:hypothetical protein